jgi:hypothetical protein
VPRNSGWRWARELILAHVQSDRDDERGAVDRELDDAAAALGATSPSGASRRLEVTVTVSHGDPAEELSPRESARRRRRRRRHARPRPGRRHAARLSLGKPYGLSRPADHAVPATADH